MDTSVIAPQWIDINDYDYDLPESRIAAFPLPERDAAKLLLYNDGQISEAAFRSLPEVLPEGAFLLFNNTRVIHARLHFQRPSGSKIEIFCLDPVSPTEHQTSLSSHEPVVWKCLIGNNKRWKERELALVVESPEGSTTLYAERLEVLGDAYAVRFHWDNPRLAFGEVLHFAGLIPLPPYLNRDNVPSDEERYQTVYAKTDGSVAAPTAGLHFTDRVLEGLKARGIEMAYVTLHVGAGTFKPVKAGKLEDHQMHQEQVLIQREVIERLLQAVQEGRPIIPVGTTSMRLLESLYWYGAKTEPTAFPFLQVGQWDPYQTAHQPSPQSALQNLLSQLDIHQCVVLHGHTEVLIAPGYSTKLAAGLITNFHQPRSTLLLLIAALIGDDWRRVYSFALERDFRFLSYGDSSLLLPGKK